jgi:Mn2+/Fe2+ NRAMP family transporter
VVPKRTRITAEYIQSCHRYRYSPIDSLIRAISTVIFVLCLMAGTAVAVKYDSYQDCKADKAAITKQLTKKKPATTTRPIHEWIPWYGN